MHPKISLEGCGMYGEGRLFHKCVAATANARPWTVWSDYVHSKSLQFEFIRYWYLTLDEHIYNVPVQIPTFSLQAITYKLLTD